MIRLCYWVTNVNVTTYDTSDSGSSTFRDTMSLVRSCVDSRSKLTWSYFPWMTSWASMVILRVVSFSTNCNSISPLEESSYLTVCLCNDKGLWPGTANLGPKTMNLALHDAVMVSSAAVYTPSWMVNLQHRFRDTQKECRAGNELIWQLRKGVKTKEGRELQATLIEHAGNDEPRHTMVPDTKESSCFDDTYRVFPNGTIRT